MWLLIQKGFFQTDLAFNIAFVSVAHSSLLVNLVTITTQ